VYIRLVGVCVPVRAVRGIRNLAGRLYCAGAELSTDRAVNGAVTRAVYQFFIPGFVTVLSNRPAPVHSLSSVGEEAGLTQLLLRPKNERENGSGKVPTCAVVMSS
jgi:hypothetical protein